MRPEGTRVEDVAYYALGGGHGHALRGMAILEALGGGTLIIPNRLRQWAHTRGVQCHSPPEPYGTDVGGEYFEPLVTPSLLLVDVFARGVVGELEPFKARTRCWLITRWVRPDYYLKPEIRSSLERTFERIVWTEPHPPELDALDTPSITTSPVLLPAPVRTRQQAYEDLSLSDDLPWIYVLATGSPEHQRNLLSLTRKIAIRLEVQLRFASDVLTPQPDIVSTFPAASYLRAADAVIASGGYHSYHEIRRAGAKAVFIPQPRRYDDQAHRVRDERVAQSPEELAHHARELLEVPHPPERRHYGMGAKETAQMLIEESN